MTLRTSKQYHLDPKRTQKRVEHLGAIEEKLKRKQSLTSQLQTKAASPHTYSP